MSDLILAHNPDPIKDCPFCGEGSDPFYSLDPNYQDRHVIECGDCGKQERYEYSKEGAIENWNRRPKEDSLQQQNTALQQQVKDLQAENSELERYYAKSIPPLATLLSLAVECDDSGDIGDKIRACVVKIKAALLSSKGGD